MSYDAIDGPCAAGGRVDVCCDHRGRALCHYCWHEARYRETPYTVARDADGYTFSGFCYLKEEAEASALEWTQRDARTLEVHRQYSLDPASTEKDRAHWAEHVRHVESIDPRW